MNNVIVCIPVDNIGNKLWLRDLETRDGDVFVKHKTTYNDMPFMETIIHPIEENYVITGDDGTVLYRFHHLWLEQLKN